MNRKAADSPRQDPIDPREYWPYQPFRDRIIPIDLELVLTEAESFLSVLKKDVFDPDQAFTAFFRFVRSTNPLGGDYDIRYGTNWVCESDDIADCYFNLNKVFRSCVNLWNIGCIISLDSPPEFDREAIKPPDDRWIPSLREAIDRLREAIGPAPPRPAIRLDETDPDRRTFLIRDDPTPYRLTNAQARVVLALIEAFPESIGKDRLEQNAEVSNAHTILKTIRKNKAWDSIIVMPGKAWAGYSIAPK